MIYKVEISGFDKEFLPVFENLAKSLKANYKVTILEATKEKRQISMQKAIKELKNGEYEAFKDFDEYKKAMRNV